MSIKTLIMTCGLAVYLLAQPAVAAEPIYNCEVSQVLDQSFPLSAGDPPIEEHAAHLSEGTSSPSLLFDFFKSTAQANADAIANLYIGQKFVINRTTGEISGVLGSSSYKNHKILRSGDEQYSFILLIEGFGAAGKQHFMYIQVAQYARDRAKPFMALGMAMGNEVLLGNCSEG